MLHALEQLSRELGFSLRRIRAVPGFSTFWIITLALGIGITTAAYSVIESYLSRELGVRESESLVSVAQAAPYMLDFSGPEVEDVRASSGAFVGLSAWTPFSTSLRVGTPEMAEGEAVDGEYFDVLGVRPLLGRSIERADNRPNSNPVVVLSNASWRRLFASDPKVIGRFLRVSGRPFEVIGVAPASFHGASARPINEPALWIPLAAAPGPTEQIGFNLNDREEHSFRIVARLMPGQTPETAMRALQSVAAHLTQAASTPGASAPGGRRLLVSSAYEFSMYHVDSGEVTRIVLTLPVLVFLVAVTNLANLSLSRGSSRLEEFAVRRALGASRARLVCEQLIDGGLLAVAGGLLGLVVGNSIVHYVGSVLRGTLGWTPQLNFDVQLKLPTFVAVLGLTTLAVVASSLFPGWQLSRTELRTLLTSDLGAPPPRWRGRANVIALQVAASVLLFLVAALGTTLLATEAQEATPTTFKSAVLVNVPFSLQQRGDQNAKDTLDSVLRSLETQPFIAAAAVASMFRPLGAPRAFVIPGDQPSTENFAGLPCSAIVATNGIFDVLGLRLVAGRGFEQRDESGSLQVAVLNQALATRLFGTSEIVGQQIVAKSSEVDFGKATQYEVIGVVQNSRVSQGQPDQILYLPFRQHFTPNVSILVKGRRDDSTGLLRILNQTVIRVDPDLATTFAGTAESASRSLPNVAFGLVTNAAVGLGLVALVLAVVGLYGVLSHVVSRRTAEFGIRLALGADRVRIVRLVLVDGAKPVGQGLLIGLAVATIVRIGVASRFSRPIGSFEVLSAALATVPLLLCAALACYLPASRAGTVEPTVALRDS